MDYKTIIGLEIHAELNTKSKMFCGCKNDPDEKKPNVNVCPICMGHPGTLPVINREAVRKVLQVGVALQADVADFTEFDRKNYFYPDIPKDYQISQYKYPLVSGGQLSGVKITRVHLEEDTARSSHESRSTNHEVRITNMDEDRNSKFEIRNSSLIDFNRAGVPLMELVTEPVIHSAEETMKFGKELQLLLQYLGVSDANMEKGEMRVEVNISVSKDQNFGTKVEVKNINSFRAAGRAIEYEFKRQTELLDKGEIIAQETRGFDENRGVTFSQRSKEDSHDYRYFPDPDLPKLQLSLIEEFSVGEIKKLLAETPEQKRERYIKDYGIKIEDVETMIGNFPLANFFEQSVKKLSSKDPEIIKIMANYIVSDLSGLMKNSSEDEKEVLQKIGDDNFAYLIEMIKRGEVSSRGAKDILKTMFEKGGDPKKIAERLGLTQNNDPEELKIVIMKIISENTQSVEDYKNGKESVIQFLVGQVMKATKGAGNPTIIKDIILETLSNNS